MDYIIDVFPVWRELWRLNKVFTKPEITKIFHGANSDVKWL
jgi:ribonuclease D